MCMHYCCDYCEAFEIFKVNVYSEPQQISGDSCLPLHLLAFLTIQLSHQLMIDNSRQDNSSPTLFYFTEIVVVYYDIPFLFICVFYSRMHKPAPHKLN